MVWSVHKVTFFIIVYDTDGRQITDVTNKNRESEIGVKFQEQIFDYSSRNNKESQK